MSATVASLVGPFVALGHMFGHGFVRHGFIAGTAIAAAAGLVGYFLVLRSQVFSADALSHVAFTGALMALILGFDARLGLFVTTIAVAVLLGALGPRGRADDVTVGSTFAWILGIGVLALSIFTSRHSGSQGTASVTILFGSIFGLDGAMTRLAAAVAVLVTVATVAVARPLLFSSLDEAVAAARGVPVRVLAYVFLVIVGATAAEAVQVVGSLLILGLLVAPAAIAMRVTGRPYRAMGVAATIGVVGVWAGLTLSYAVPQLPPSFSILGVLTGTYAVVHGITAIVRPRRRGAVAAGPCGPAASPLAFSRAVRSGPSS